MSNENFIALEETQQEIKTTVDDTKTNVGVIKEAVNELKLSTETIDQIADTILERIGLTNDSGGVLQQEVSLLNLTLCSALGAAA